MGETAEIRTNNRERILIDLKNIIKQVYHEAVNQELSPDNVTYITQSLIKRLDETLLFGLKQPLHGYWKIVQKILHPDALHSLSNIPGFHQAEKERTWIALSLLDESLVSYMNCFVAEKLVNKVYEDWSVLRHSDACNSLISLLSGIESVSFQYNVIDAYTLPNNVRLSPRLCGPPLPWSPPPSLTDSGVQLDRSDDYLNGNLPAGGDAGGVVMRRKSKATHRHVSFHEDSLGKSPSQRKLRWDVESSRYSWAGEELDALRLPGLRSGRGERGAPEGEETPTTSAPDLYVVPVPVATVKRGRRLSTRKFRYDRQQLLLFTKQLDAEVSRHRRQRSMYELQLPNKLANKLNVRGDRHWAYKLWGGKVIIVTADRFVILHKDLTSTQLFLPQIEQIVILPHDHELHILTRKQTHILTCGDRALSHEVLTRLAYQLHIAGLHQVCYRSLEPSDMYHVKQELINQKIVSWDDTLCYMGLVRLQPSHSCQNMESVEKQGSVMCLTTNSAAWRPANLVLRGGSLHLYGETRSPIASVNLVSSCLACERSIFADRPHTFTITLKETEESQDGLYQQLAKSPTSPAGEESLLRKWMNRRSGTAVGEWVSRALGHPAVSPPAAIHIAAADEYSMSEWLEALLDVFCQGSRDELKDGGDANEGSLVITHSMVVLMSHGSLPGEPAFKVLGSALIHDIASFRIGSHSHDSYCIIELECQEAGSSTFDWLLHFGSHTELNQAIAALKANWTHPDPFPLITTSDSRCERTQDCLTREWFA